MNVIKKPQATVIELTAATLNVNNVKEFKADMEPYLESETHIILDLNKLSFVDSSGLGSFLFCLKRLNQKGGDLKLCNVTKPVRILFEMVRFHQIIDIFNSQDEALASFA
jgi:anti-sigma B factor antagonist